MSEHSKLGSFGETAGIQAGLRAVTPKLHSDLRTHARIQRSEIAWSGARVRGGVEVLA